MKKQQPGVFSLFTWIFYSASFAACLLLLAGCGAGGGEGSADNSVTLQQGVFVDSPVAGLNYRTSLRLGVTDSNGRFSYRQGELLTFLLGDLELGQVEAKGIITPVDLVAGASGATDPTVTNICRLLQTLDVDGDPDNGIELPAAVNASVAGRSIDFTASPEDFGSDLEVLDLLADLNNQETFPGGVRTLVSAAQARSHLQTTLGQEGSGGDQDCSDNDPDCSTAESGFERTLRGLINAYRRQSGLGDLVFDPALYQLAREHSADMEALGVLSHDGFQERFTHSGYRSCVENVAWNYQTPEALLIGWQNSPGHDQNLLKQHLGFVGVAKVGAYSTFFACGN